MVVVYGSKDNGGVVVVYGSKDNGGMEVVYGSDDRRCGGDVSTCEQNSKL